MRRFTPSALVALLCLPAFGSGGCLLLTSLSGLDDPLPAEPPSAEAAAGDGPITEDGADAGAAGDGRAAPVVEIVAHDDPGITSIAVHSDGLYYVRPQAGALYHVARADFGAAGRGTALINDGGAFQGVVVTALDVFLSVSFPTNGTCIVRTKHDGSGLAPVQSYCLLKSHMVASPSAIFAVGEDSSSVNGVWRVDVATGVSSRLFAGVRTNGGQILSGVAYDGAKVYVSDEASSKISTLASTSALADVATVQTVIDMAADSTTLYWIAQNGAVRSLPVIGAGQAPREVAKLVAPQRLAVDESSVYLTTSGLTPSSGTLVRIAKDTGAKTELATGLANPSAIVLDATHVYWANLDDGTIMRIAKK